jgi:hypothetical protein
MRWLMLVLLILGLALTFTTKSPGVLAIGLGLGFVGLFGLIFLLAADRVSSGARPESAMLGPEELAAMRARQAGTRPRPTATSAAPPVAVPPARPAATTPKASQSPTGGTAR